MTRALAAMLIAVVACGGRAGPAPSLTAGTAAYAAALRADDPRAAWNLLSRELRAELDYASFSARWHESRAEREQQARELEGAMASDTAFARRARVRYADGKTVRLSHDLEGWRLDSPLVSRDVAHSPLDAVELFAAAVEQRDFQAVLGALTARRREGINAFINQFAAALRTNKRERGVEYQGRNRAVLQWDEDGTRYKIILVREQDEWRVDDFDVLPAAEP